MRCHLRIEADVRERRLQLVGDLIHKGHPLLRHAQLAGAFVEIKPGQHDDQHHAGAHAQHDGEKVGLWEFLIGGGVGQLPLAERLRTGPVSRRRSLGALQALAPLVQRHPAKAGEHHPPRWHLQSRVRQAGKQALHEPVGIQQQPAQTAVRAFFPIDEGLLRHMPAADGAGSRGWRGDFVDVIAAELLKRLPGGFSAFCAGAGDESGRNPLKRRPATRIRHDRFRARAEGACPALEFRHQFHWLQPAWRIEGIFTGHFAEFPAGIQGPGPGRPRVLDEPTRCGCGTGRTRRDRIEFIRELP